MTDDELKQLLSSCKTVAVVGLSDNSDRPSFEVASYLKYQGYHVIPVNPKYVTILGATCYPDLLTAQKELGQEKIDVVDIFRRSELVAPHVDEAITIKPKLIFMQEGVEHHEAAKKARDAGIVVVMNQCLMKTHQKMFA